jgi:ABC-2 type transport system permease protein
MNFQRILALLSKEFSQLFKDKKLLPLVFVAPVAQLVFMGYAASLDVKNVSIVLCDLDKTASSRGFVTSFTNSGYFTIEYSTEDYASIQQYLDNHKATLALVIPKGFGNKLLRKESAKVQVLLDGSEGSAAAVTMGYVNQIIMKYSTSILAEMVGAGQTIASVTTETRAWYNPALKSRNFMVPGVLVMILLITTTNLTSMAIVKEKEIGTLEQLLVTPIKAPELILGKLVPFIIIAFVNVCVVLVAMVVGFGIPVKGSLGLLFLLSSFFLLTSLGLGLFVSTVSRTQQQAMMTTMFFIIMPMMYLSGFVFPVENMPKILQLISYGIPMRHFLIIVRSIILKGVGLQMLWFEALALLGMGTFILVLSMLRFHRKLD